MASSRRRRLIAPPFQSRARPEKYGCGRNQPILLSTTAHSLARRASAAQRRGVLRLCYSRFTVPISLSVAVARPIGVDAVGHHHPPSLPPAHPPAACMRTRSFVHPREGRDLHTRSSHDVSKHVTRVYRPVACAVDRAYLYGVAEVWMRLVPAGQLSASAAVRMRSHTVCTWRANDHVIAMSGAQAGGEGIGLGATRQRKRGWPA
ncbi:hypothetical protein EV714DRAFT_278404 [Schizophyllum commune]